MEYVFIFLFIFLLQVAVSFWHPSVHFTILNGGAGRAPVVSSKHKLPLLSWYNSPPFPNKGGWWEAKGRRVSTCVCVRVHGCVNIQIQGAVHERYWKGYALFALSDIVVLFYVSKVLVDDTGCKSSVNTSGHILVTPL